jgi:hypothetical protein
VRDAYRERISDGMDGAAATTDLIEQWLGELPPDDEDVLVFWLAIAATQWKAGRLEDRIRDKAIAVIDSGKDLRRWADSRLIEKRAEVLRKLKDQLLSPQPAPKNIRVQKPQVPPWSCGDYVSYRLASGQFVIFYVEAANEGHDVKCSLLDWVGCELPDDATILTLPKRLPARMRDTRFSIYTMKKRGIPFARLKVLNVKNLEAVPDRGGGWCFDWKDIDYHLKDSWGLE